MIPQSRQEREEVEVVIESIEDQVEAVRHGLTECDEDVAQAAAGEVLNRATQLRAMIPGRPTSLTLFALADLKGDEARDALAKALADRAVGKEAHPNHVSMFNEEAEALLEALAGALGGGGE